MNNNNDKSMFLVSEDLEPKYRRWRTALKSEFPGVKDIEFQSKSFDYKNQIGHTFSGWIKTSNVGCYAFPATWWDHFKRDVLLRFMPVLRGLVKARKRVFDIRLLYPYMIEDPERTVAKIKERPGSDTSGQACGYKKIGDVFNKIR